MRRQENSLRGRKSDGWNEGKIREGERWKNSREKQRIRCPLEDQETLIAFAETSPGRLDEESR